MPEDESWLFDSVMGFLKSPGWALPVMSFIDENCVVFDEEDENKLAYMVIYNAFKEMVDSLLEMHLQDMGVSVDQFTHVCSTMMATHPAGREALEQILAVDDYVSFKKMMVKRNMELELAALEMLKEMTEKVTAQPSASRSADPPAEDDFEAQLQRALELSLQEGTLMEIKREELEAQQRDKEDADLQMAIVMSMQIDDEKKKIDAAAAEPPRAAPPAPKATEPAEEAAPPPKAEPAKVAAPTPTAAAPVPAAPAAPEAQLAPKAATTPAPSALGALAPLRAAPLPGRAAPAAPCIQEIRASEAAARAAEARARAEKDSEAQADEQAKRVANTGAALSAKQQAEMKARADHLRKQRDLIVSQRKKQRETDAAAYRPPPPPPQATREAPSLATDGPPQADAMRRPAGYSEEVTETQVQRAMLSRALASNMKASLLGGGDDSMGVDGMVGVERKADFEATKAALRLEADAARNA